MFIFSGEDCWFYLQLILSLSSIDCSFKEYTISSNHTLNPVSKPILYHNGLG